MQSSSAWQMSSWVAGSSYTIYDLSNFMRSIEVVSVALRIKAKLSSFERSGLPLTWPAYTSALFLLMAPFSAPSCSSGSFPPHGLCSSLLFPPCSPTQLLSSSSVPSSEKPPFRVSALLEVSVALVAGLPPAFTAVTDWCLLGDELMSTFLSL